MNDNKLNSITSAAATIKALNDTEYTVGTTVTLSDAYSNWAPWTGSNRCPNCGSNKIEYNTNLVLTTYPAQSQLRCKDCDHYFSSGFTSTCTREDALDKLWKHDQSILGKPQVGDWPPAPQVGDWPPYNRPGMPEIEPPSYPDISNPRKASPIGWICPKCGSCLAPHVNSCPHCVAPTQLTITY